MPSARPTGVGRAIAGYELPIAVIHMVGALGWLLLIPLSTRPGSGPTAGLVRTVEAVARDQLIAIPFALGALMFYVLLHQSRLVPRWLSSWGLVGAAPSIVPPLGSMFGLPLGILMAPLALQEMAMAVWLVAKGFNAPAIADEAADETPRWPAVGEVSS